MALEWMTRMALDPKAEATLALHRFGLGPRPGSGEAIASDPRGALLAGPEASRARAIAQPNLMTSGEAARAALRFQEAQRLARQAQRDARGTGPQTAGPPGAAAPENRAPQPPPPPANAAGPAPQQIYLDEAKARFAAALDAEIGFGERLRWFSCKPFLLCAPKGPGVAVRGGCEG